MTEIKRRIARRIGRIPFAAAVLQRLAHCGFVAFSAHVVSDERLPHVRHLYSYRNVRQFEADLEILLKTRRPIALDDLVAALGAGRSPPADACLLTFDDGLREAAEVIAPILKRRGVPAAFFVNTDFVDNNAMFFRHKESLIVDALDGKGGSALRQVADTLMAHGVRTRTPKRALLGFDHGQQGVLDSIAASLDLDFDGFLRTRQPYLRLTELRAMAADGFAIGAHSRSHPLFARLPYEAQCDEALASIEFIRRNLNPASLAFSFPFHDAGVSEQLFAEMAAAGVQVSFGSAGLRRDVVPWNVHRIPSENAASDIGDDLTVACLKGLLYRLAGKGTVIRPRLPASAAAPGVGADVRSAAIALRASEDSLRT